MTPLTLGQGQRQLTCARSPTIIIDMDLYEEIVRLRKDGRRGAVATIVNVRGSIPSFKTAKRRNVERDLPHMSWFHRRPTEVEPKESL